MIKIPYEQIIEKITSNSNIPKEEIEIRIKKKMDQLSGLISREGAAHIIANELNIKIFEQTSGRLQIKNILPGLRNVEVVGKVSKKYDLKEFRVGSREGKMASFVLGDETGTIRVVMWGNVADNIKQIKENDIVKITSAYSRDNNGYRELHMNEKSELTINPEGEKVESSQFIRKTIAELKENENNVEILGTIVDMFDPKFFEICSECNRRAREGKCDAHPNAGVSYSYVLNAFLDDGTDNIRIVMFRDLMHDLIGKSHEEILTIKDHPESFAAIKKSLLGTQIKTAGRVVKNQMFDRLELIVNHINAAPDAEEEIKRLT